jgi:hypothetical protein
MEQFETRFNQVDVLPMVKHFMDRLDLSISLQGISRQQPEALRIMLKAYAY